MASTDRRRAASSQLQIPPPLPSRKIASDAMVSTVHRTAGQRGIKPSRPGRTAHCIVAPVTVIRWYGVHVKVSYTPEGPQKSSGSSHSVDRVQVHALVPGLAIVAICSRRCGGDEWVGLAHGSAPVMPGLVLLTTEKPTNHDRKSGR